MVYAVQIRIHGGWSTVAVHNDAGSADVNTVSASRVYDCSTRVKSFASEADAWKR